MAKKLKLDINYFEDYALLSISSQLKDYRLAFFINDTLDLDLKKYEDFSFNGKKGSYSWYFDTEGIKSSSFYLFSNNHEEGKLIPSPKGIDFFLLVKDVTDNHHLDNLASSIRRIPGVLGVFKLDMTLVKNMDAMIEAIELHELEYVIKPAKKDTGWAGQ